MLLIATGADVEAKNNVRQMHRNSMAGLGSGVRDGTQWLIVMILATRGYWFAWICSRGLGSCAGGVVTDNPSLLLAWQRERNLARAGKRALVWCLVVASRLL